MVNFADIVTLPYKLASAGPRMVINLATGKTDCGDLLPCGNKNNTSSSSSSTENEGLMSNPLGG